MHKSVALRSKSMALFSIFVLVGLLLVPASPASAAPKVTVTTAADGRFAPGKPVALLVEITATRGTEGTIEVRLDGVRSVSQNFELAGGATKTIVVVTETLQWGASLAVEIKSSDGDQTLRPRLQEERESELVGILPSLVDRNFPATGPAGTTERQARLFALSEAVVGAGPRALSMFDSIIGSSQDLTAASPEATSALTSWLIGGGDLILNDAAGTALPTLGVASDQRQEVALGFGSIRFVNGDLSGGSVEGLIRPSSISTGEEFGMGMNSGFSGQVLMTDAGIAIPEIGVLLIITGVYILLVGPGLFLLLRGLRKLPLMWLAVPAIAAVTVGAVYGLGRAVRADTDLAHATVVATINGAEMNRSEILVASANGGFSGVQITDGFEQSSVGMNNFNGRLSPSPERRGDQLGFQQDPGEISLLTVERALPPGRAAAPVLQTDFQIVDRTVVGTVTNAGSVVLEDVQVSVGNQNQRIGTLGPGVSEEVTFNDSFTTVPVVNDPLIERMQQDFFNNFENKARPEGAVNAGVFMNWVAQNRAARRTGHSLAVGWTREANAPLRTLAGTAITSGRTAYVTVNSLPLNDTPTVEYGEGTAQVQRVWDFEMAAMRQGNFVEIPMEVRLDLPGDADVNGDYLLEVPEDVSALELWNGLRWEPAEERIVEGSGLLLQSAEVTRGTVQLRVGYRNFGRNRTPVLRTALPQEVVTLRNASSEIQPDPAEATDQSQGDGDTEKGSVG